MYTMPTEQTGHAKLCYVVDGKEIELGDFYCDLQMETDIDCSDADGNVPDPTKPISGTIRIKKTPAHKKFRIKRYLISLFKAEFRNRFKSRYKRKKLFFRYLMERWRQHKPIEFGNEMLREKDWYRLIEIVKRGGPGWLAGMSNPYHLSEEMCARCQEQEWDMMYRHYAGKRK